MLFPLDYPALSVQKELENIAGALLTLGKGILAADESPGSMEKRMGKYGIENTPEKRQSYRELLFTIDEKDLATISGVILHDETVHQKSSDGILFVELLKNRNIIPGIKVDRGAKPELGSFEEELAERCNWYKKKGLQFAKWRSVFTVSMINSVDVNENAAILGRYASICQSYGLVPIVEPEVLQDGSHTIEECQKVTVQVLSAVFKALIDHNVHLEGILLKPHMVLAGSSCEKKSNPEEIALATITAFQRTVPVAVPGIVFLSGGQGEEEATVNLNAINQLRGKKPWVLSFSFGRALQSSVLCIWKGKDVNVGGAQAALTARARANGLAAQGLYKPGDVPSVADMMESL